MQMPHFLSSLNEQKGLRSDFVGRVSEVEVALDKDEVLARLKPAHQKAVQDLGFCWSQLHLAEQIHGSNIAIVGKHDPVQTWRDVDGLITSDISVLLGIYVADCGAVYIYDPVCRVIALLHSGKKGTEANITGKAIKMMQDDYGSSPADMVVVLSPCVRPPIYEVDFASDIRQQALAAGVPESQYADACICTASNTEDYYSYRMERGKTGRMLALLGMV
jgi:copper oxidase (laccase) domain-containing protein